MYSRGYDDSSPRGYADDDDDDDDGNDDADDDDDDDDNEEDDSDILRTNLHKHYGGLS